MNYTRREFCYGLGAGAGLIAMRSGWVPPSEPVKVVPGVPIHLAEYAELYRKSPMKASQKWFRDAKFGLFIHYGLYSLGGVHPFHQFYKKVPVKEYEKRAEKFTAEKFDPDFICDMALEAGMKYVNLVAKHCDGFCLWDTKLTDFNSVNSAAKRDLVGEMVEACNKRGLGFFAFYEHGFDWRHPHAPRRKDFSTKLVEVNYPEPEPTYAYGDDYDLNKYLDFASDQVAELLTNYGPIAGIWLDGIGVPLTGDKTLFRCQELYDRIHSIQPHAMVSYKHGVTGTEDFKAPEHWQLKKVDLSTTKIPIEMCETPSKGWGYVKGAKHNGADWAWGRLAFARSKGINYLLNTGPLGDGSIHPKDLAMFKEIGRRLRKHGWPGDMEKVEREDEIPEAF